MSTSTYPVRVDDAITSVSLETKIANGAGFVPDRLLGDTRLSLTPLAGALRVRDRSIA